MNKEKFVKSYLEKLIEKDSDIKGHFDNEKDNERRDFLKERLRYSMEKSYDKYAENYFDTKGLGSYVSTFLRYAGGAADAIGTYLFWAFGGAGFSMKGAGFVAKSLADVIDSTHYARTATTRESLEKITDSGKILGEGILERAAAYLPLGMGELADLIRGRSKFDDRVVSRAIGYAKQNFVSYIKSKKAELKEEKETKIIPLDRFRHPIYADQRKSAA